MREDLLLPEERKGYLSRPLWWMGFLGVLAAAIGDFVALAMASQALVAALGGGTTLLTNVLVARVCNGDKLVWSDAIGVLLIIGGAVYFAFEQDAPEVDDLQEIENNFKKKWMIIYLAAQGFVIFVLL